MGRRRYTPNFLPQVKGDGFYAYGARLAITKTRMKVEVYEDTVSPNPYGFVPEKNSVSFCSDIRTFLSVLLRQKSATD